MFQPTDRRAARTRRAALPLATLAALTLTLALAAPAPAGELPSRFSDEEMTCLALNIYHEARNQPVEGQLAVAHVTLNRLSEAGRPTSLCEVVHRPGAFSWSSDPELAKTPPSEGEAWHEAQRIARQAVAERPSDPVKGSTYFHAVSVMPQWAPRFIRVRQIGDHVFYAPPSTPAARVEPRYGWPVEILMPR